MVGPEARLDVVRSHVQVARRASTLLTNLNNPTVITTSPATQKSSAYRICFQSRWRTCYHSNCAARRLQRPISYQGVLGLSRALPTEYYSQTMLLEVG